MDALAGMHKDALVAILCMFDFTTISSLSIACKWLNSFLKRPDVCGVIISVDTRYDARVCAAMAITVHPCVAIKRIRKRLVARDRSHLIVNIAHHMKRCSISALVTVDILPDTLRLTIKTRTNMSVTHRVVDVVDSADLTLPFAVISRAISGSNMGDTALLCHDCNMVHENVQFYIPGGFFDLETLPGPEGNLHGYDCGYYMGVCTFTRMFQLQFPQ